MPWATRRKREITNAKFGESVFYPWYKVGDLFFRKSKQNLKAKSLSAMNPITLVSINTINVPPNLVHVHTTAIMKKKVYSGRLDQLLSHSGAILERSATTPLCAAAATCRRAAHPPPLPVAPPRATRHGTSRCAPRRAAGPSPGGRRGGAGRGGGGSGRTAGAG